MLGVDAIPGQVYLTGANFYASTLNQEPNPQLSSPPFAPGTTGVPKGALVKAALNSKKKNGRSHCLYSPRGDCHGVRGENQGEP